ncbi:MAG: hypothetical protein LBQ11_02730 [Candidatus Nomurabacteria bacterium]|jgi:hypothetical protein|nr:hypothetical protein [Candidatus Nomurabacteria bacterium]
MKERGFTIIEVALFLAISGLLILLTIGLWNMVARQRFYDTMTTLRSVIQAEYEEVRTSMNERLGEIDITGCGLDGDSREFTGGDKKTGNTKCLVIGKLLQFKPGSREIEISYIVATEDVSNVSVGDMEALKNLGTTNKLAVIREGSGGNGVQTTDPAVIPKTIRIEWGGEFVQSLTIPPATGAQTLKASDALAILRSPVSSTIVVFSSPAVGSGDGLLSLNDSSAGQPIAVMVKNDLVGFKGGAICIGNGASSVVAKSVVPADNFYDFGNTTNPTDSTKLRSLCSI